MNFEQRILAGKFKKTDLFIEQLFKELDIENNPKRHILLEKSLCFTRSTDGINFWETYRKANHLVILIKD